MRPGRDVHQEVINCGQCYQQLNQDKDSELNPRLGCTGVSDNSVLAVVCVSKCQAGFSLRANEREGNGGSRYGPQ